MANGMENYNNISCDSGQSKTTGISVLTRDKINMMVIRMENYNHITSDTGKDKTDCRHSIW